MCITPIYMVVSELSNTSSPTNQPLGSDIIQGASSFFYLDDAFLV
jgi:hypothetical protein